MFSAAIVILIIGYIVAKLLEKGTDALLEKLHFDQALSRGGVNIAATAVSPRALAAIRIATSSTIQNNQRGYDAGGIKLGARPFDGGGGRRQWPVTLRV